MEGTCNCGAIRVKVDDDELFSRPRGHICHCFNCRKTSGSALATNLRIEASKVAITGEDSLSRYDDSDSLTGNTVERYFCRTCGNPIKSETLATKKAGTVILKLGIFPRIPQPEFEGFAKDRLEWVKSHATNGEFKTALGGEKLKAGAEGIGEQDDR